MKAYSSLLDDIKTRRKEFNQEKTRLYTFKEYQTETRHSITILAYLGFFYLDAKLLCYCCSFICLNFDNLSLQFILQEHIRHADTCDKKQTHENFLKRISPSNTLLNSKTQSFQTKNEELLNEDYRYDTFFNVELTQLDARVLANNGFYVSLNNIYSQMLVKIQCAFCAYETIVFKTRAFNTSYVCPIVDHKDKSPKCSIFLNANCTNNVITESKTNLFSELEDKSINSTINTKNSLIRDEINNKIRNTLNKALNTESNDEPFLAVYDSMQSRIDSFKNWPSYLMLNPNRMAEAGFYYTGKDDVVKCYFCNGGICNWEPIEDPLYEHIRWYPRCLFIQKKVSPSIIAQIQSKYQTTESDSDNSPHYYNYIRGDTKQNLDYETNYDNSNDKKKLNNRVVLKARLSATLDLTPIRKTIDFGVSRKTIKQAITEKYEKDGQEYESVIDLIIACLKIEYIDKMLIKHLKEKYHLYLSNFSCEVKENDIAGMLKSRFNVEPENIFKLNSANNAYADVLVSLKVEDLVKCDKIVSELNGKPLVELKSPCKIIVKKTIENHEIEARLEDFYDKCSIRKDHLMAKPDNSHLVETRSLNIDNKPFNNVTIQSMPAYLQDVEETRLNVSFLQRSQSSYNTSTPPNSMDTNSFDNKKTVDNRLLSEQLESLKKLTICAICKQNRIAVTFMPCSHFISCIKCAENYKICPKCGDKIELTIKTYN